MTVPVSIRRSQATRRRTRFGAAMLLGSAASLMAKPPEPRRIPLAPLGFETVSSRFLAAGSSLLTVHFVDDTHVLVTFAVHRLLKRLPDDPPEHDDHTIEAVLVDTAHATAVARTEWRLHDHRQYLWSLGHGVFLLRSDESLSTFTPMANLEQHQPFLTHTILEAGRTVEAVLLSHDRGLLTVETSARRRPAKDGAPAAAEEHPVQLDFYRVHVTDEHGISVVHAGVAHARTGVVLPTDSSGFVSAADQGHGQWAFDFHEYAGKTHELALFDSSCQPHTSLVSRSEFVALACTGGTERRLLAAFNLSGEEMWQQQFYRAYAFPVFEFAPAAGRFALSRIMTSTGAAPAVSDQTDTQSITVYQTDSGKQLLTVETTPMARAGGNFALSDDGMSLALVRNDTLEIFPLPELSGKDRAAVRKAAAAAPPAFDGPVRFATSAEAAPLAPPPALNVPSAASAGAASGKGGVVATAGDSAGSEVAEPSSVAAGSAPPPATTPAGPPPVTASGDPDPDHPERPRPRPTLYTMPGDAPHPAQDGPQ